MSLIRKTSLALLATIACALTALAQEQEGIPVHLKPDAESPLIGSLETIALAVNADWPEGDAPASGWQPIYFRGLFEVYIANDSLAKDLSPKPGSQYLLSMEPDAELFALATKSDKTEILEVNANHCKLQLETIVLAYIPDAASISTSASNPLKTTASSGKQTLNGILTATNRTEKEKHGYQFKLVDSENKLMAFLDTKALPADFSIKDFINLPVQAVGTLNSVADGSRFALAASIVKKAN